MNHLIKHLVLNNIDEIVNKSLLNCHCKGLHSIMLLESPQKTIRLYISDKGNELYKNLPEFFNNEDMSVSFHPHHCNLTLHCIKGSFLNWEVKESNDGFEIDKYLYKSKISDGELKFDKTGKSKLKTINYNWVKEGESIHMDAKDLHTVACYENEVTAWLVYEGQEDLNYESICYSNSNPNEMDSTGYYIKLDKNKIIELLKLVGFLD